MPVKPGSGRAGAAVLRRFAVPAAVRGAVRAAILAVVVSALFVMHGPTTAAAGGCHGAAAMPTMAAVRAPAAPAAAVEGARPASGPGVAAIYRGQAAAAVGGDLASPHPTMCLSTAPRSLLALILVVVSGLLVADREGRPRCHVRRAWPRRTHAPPGRALLTRLCVART